jgi:hypothetical protein
MPKVTGKLNPQDTPSQNAKSQSLVSSDQQRKQSKNGNGKAAANGKAKPAEKKREIVYPRIEVKVFHRNPKKVPTGGKPQAMTPAIMKELLGWQDEEQYEALLKSKLPPAEFKQANTKFGDDYLFLDRYGKKVRLMNNLDNRPFDPRNAEDQMLEILRLKWEFNGESMIIDEHGSCQDIQHRGVGLIWAEQEWEKDSILPEPDRQWGHWKTAPEIDCLVVLGIDPSDKVINTINTGKPRSFADALFRSEVYKQSPRQERERLSKITSGAVAYLWKRTEAALSSLAPRRPHSESFEFLESHPKILDCVRFILAEGDGKKLTPFLSLGYASALLYLMGSAGSDVAKYADANCKEAVLDWKLWEKAQEFWVLFCANAAVLEPLHEELNRLPVELTGVEFKTALFVKAWNFWSASTKKKISKEEWKEVLELAIDDSGGISKLSEYPRIGGIDIDREEEPETSTEVEGEPTEDELASTDAMAQRGICPKLSDTNKKPTPHEFITESGETYCKHCFDPAPKSGKKKGKK